MHNNTIEVICLMPVTTTLEREQRREKVKRMVARGITAPAHIANALDVSRKTVYNDMEAIREEVLNDEQMGNGEMLFQIALRMDTVNRELWRLHEKAQQDSVKLGTLNSIRQNNRDYVDILSKLGVIEQQAQRIRWEMRKNDPDVKELLEALQSRGEKMRLLRKWDRII
ncbi:hypothetical protein [Vibrio sp.]|uniref:hypothetical protein n=1 Tax=Vibrio sp. TaxID=678 RepID=UPI003D14B9D8